MRKSIGWTFLIGGFIWLLASFWSLLGVFDIYGFVRAMILLIVGGGILIVDEKAEQEKIEAELDRLSDESNRVEEPDSR